MDHDDLIRLLPAQLCRSVYVEAARRGITVQEVIIQDVRQARCSCSASPPKRCKGTADHAGLIRRLLESPKPDRETLEAARVTPGFFGSFMRHVLPVFDSDPAQGLPFLDVAHRIVTGSCDLVVVIGLRGFAYRQLGAPGRELQELERATFLAGDCRSCHAHLKRRRGRAYGVIGEASLALIEANEAIELYEELQSLPRHHDVFGDGLARAYLARANIRQDIGIGTGDQKLLSFAVEDVATALDLIDPDVSPRLHRLAVFNLAAALYATGKPKDLELADLHLTTARRLFKGCERRSTERARLGWITAMVRYELRNYRTGNRKIRPARVRKLLDEALSTFLYLGMPFEACAVASDRMRVAYPDRDEVVEIVADLTRQLEERLEQIREYQPRLWTNLGDVEPLRRALGWVEQAAGHRDLGLETVRDTIDDLREACGPGMLKCLIRWQE